MAKLDIEFKVNGNLVRHLGVDTSDDVDESKAGEFALYLRNIVAVGLMRVLGAKYVGGGPLAAMGQD